ncbi:hypothetical protein EXT68_02415 [Pectobacterium parmentieri]|uniref:hypothetical protein n=1 Tax=Pectobacterium TaxID=122277 RepID=UPI00201B3C65|nr:MULTISPECIES: hypothetical protein [Pectobacterium]MCL6354372.1 hypothetical protein [Pectobacterium parmentieri]MCL6398388.1 hypothetical protein [Pectobacterium carotovorum subsp. carotovorum]
MNTKPWERRLKDLSHLLGNCAETYFDPELFRLNLNQFLQTSRTVTFIIQKNKSEIEGFDKWYPEFIVEKWRNDPLMNWAKNSRNTIEKQGDLEMFSEARATLIFSYLEEQDIEITTHENLIKIGVKKLVRLAQKKLSSAVSSDAVIRSERRWVANTLENYELLHALTLIYSRIYDCCKSLGEFIGNPISDNIITPISFESLRNETRHVNYLKLRNFSTGEVSFETVKYNSESIPNTIKCRLDKIDKSSEVKSIEELVENLSKIAEFTFLEYGSHIPTLFFFNSDYQVIDLLNTIFEDQADKYVFWRVAADRAKVINACGFIWISELWLRRSNLDFKEAIHKMPIIGERLQIVGVDSRDNQSSISWEIIRDSDKDKPRLDLITIDKNSDGKAYFMRPILKAIGGDISKLND